MVKILKYIGISLFAAILCVNFAACSDDNEESTESDNLQEIVVGAWAQDGDNDIFLVNADGTGIGYENSEDYEQNVPGYTFTWTYKNEWVEVKIKDLYGVKTLSRNGDISVV